MGDGWPSPFFYPGACKKSFLQSERLTLQLILTELILNTFQYEYNTKYEISMKSMPCNVRLYVAEIT